METYEKRMVDEYKELCDKIEKLNVFITENENDDSVVSNEHYRMMMVQYYAMCAYEGALRMRIEDLGINIKD